MLLRSDKPQRKTDRMPHFELARPLSELEIKAVSGGYYNTDHLGAGTDCGSTPSGCAEDRDDYQCYD